MRRDDWLSSGFVRVTWLDDMPVTMATSAAPHGVVVYLSPRLLDGCDPGEIAHSAAHLVLGSDAGCESCSILAAMILDEISGVLGSSVFA